MLFFQVLLESVTLSTFQRHQFITFWTQCITRPYASHWGPENSTDENVGLSYFSIATSNFCVRGNERTELLKGNATVLSWDCPFSSYSPFAAFYAERQVKVCDSLDQTIQTISKQFHEICFNLKNKNRFTPCMCLSIFIPVRLV